MENPDEPKIRIVGFASQERKDRMRTEFQEIVSALEAREGSHYNDAVQAAFNTVCILHAFSEMLVLFSRVTSFPKEVIEEVKSLLEHGPTVAGQVRHLAAVSILLGKQHSVRDAIDQDTNPAFAATLRKLNSEVTIMIRKQEEYRKGK